MSQGDNYHTIIDTDSEQSEDVWVVWILAGDRKWYLCCRCVYCEALMQYPGAPHRCPVSRNTFEAINELGVVDFVHTSLRELTEGLRCSETFLSTED